MTAKKTTASSVTMDVGKLYGDFKLSMRSHAMENGVNDHEPPARPITTFRRKRRLRNGRRPTIFAIALLLASLQQQHDGRSHVGGGVLADVSSSSSSSSSSASTSIERGPKRLPRQRRREHDRHEEEERHRHHHRRKLLIERPNPYLPDYTSNHCKNDKPAESWMDYPSLPKTAEDCCKNHFNWDKMCMANTMKYVMMQKQQEYSGSVEKSEYYPDTVGKVCKKVSSAMPNWITTIENNYEECCRKWLSWSLNECMAAEPALSEDAKGKDKDGGNGGSGGGGGGPVKVSVIGKGDDTETPTEMPSTSPPRSNPVANNNSPPKSSPNEPPVTASVSSSTDVCILLTRKQCLRNDPYCTWVEDPYGPDRCASPYSIITTSKSNGGNVAVKYNDCGTYTKDECRSVAGCTFVKKTGCVPVAASNSGGEGGDRSVNNDDRNGSGVDPCEKLSQQACTASSSTCSYNKRKGCYSSSESTTNTVTAASASPVMDCSAFEREECISRSNQCTWHKKTGCDAVPAPTLRPTTKPTSRPTSRKWYYDPDDGRCKVDSPDRPSWLTQTFDEYETCCKGSWDKNGCLADMEEMLHGDDGVKDGKGDADAVERWYYDSGDGMCKVDSPDRPSWLAQIFDDPLKCCSISWDLKKCVAQFEYLNEDDDHFDDDDDEITSDTDSSFVFIDLTVYGSIQLRGFDVPSPTSPEWNKLKRALTKTIILVLTEYDKMVHPDMEVELWSIGGESFTWRRERRKRERTLLAENGPQEVGDDDTEDIVPSSLRGANVVVIQQEPQQQQQHRRRMASSELQFECIIPTKCDTACQSDTLVALGKSSFDLLNAYFQTAVTDGDFSVTMKTVGESMGLFRNEYPTAANGVLTYRYAVRSSKDITWSPSYKPTLAPTALTAAPTDDVYWPDSVNTVCRTGLGHSEFNVNFFGSMDECCHFPWMEDWDLCMENSKKAAFVAGLPTPPPVKPTRKPTPAPTKAMKPKTKRPTKKPTREPIRGNSSPATSPPPTRKPNNKPTPQPVKNSNPSSPVVAPAPPQGPAVYYPDLTLGVCKFDGKHGNTPYQFSTPQACCTNKWMDYNKCMAYADPYAGLPLTTKFYPDIYEGYCKSDGKHEGLDPRMVFDGPEECCDNVWMVYQDCVRLSRDPPPPDNTSPTAPSPAGPSNPTAPTTPKNPPARPPAPTPPTPKPTKRDVDPTKLTGEFYPDFDGGLCIDDDGKKSSNHPYIFETLAKCCTNNVMDYNDCVSYSIEVYFDNDGGGGSGSTGGGGDTSGCVWYPDPSRFGTCTFSSLYPDAWAEKPDLYLFDTRQECCMGAFGDADCAQRYNCNGNDAGPTPTGYVTVSPTTYYPTFNPTRGPGNSGGGGGNPGGNPGNNPGPPGNNNPGSPPSPPASKPTNVPTRSPTRKPIQNDIATPPPTSKPTTLSVPTNRPTKQPIDFTIPPVVTTQIDASNIAYELKDGFENGLTGTFPWHTSPDLPWSPYAEDKTEGEFSARSNPNLGPGETSDLHVAIKSLFGGVLYFDFKTDVKMPFSGCYINIDGESKKGYTFAKPDWMELSLPIPEGERVVMFRAWAPDMGKPDVDSGVSSTIGLDNVSFMPSFFEDFEAGKLRFNDAMKLDGSWTFDWTSAHEGKAALRSPDGKSGRMTVEIDVPRRGSDLNFWYLASVRMPFDSFKFKINDNIILWRKDLETGWKQFTRALPPGKYKLEWEYVQEGGDGNHPGEAAVWIDDVGIVGKF